MTTTEQALKAARAPVLPETLAEKTGKSVQDTIVDLSMLNISGKAEEVGGRWKWKGNVAATSNKSNTRKATAHKRFLRTTEQALRDSPAALNTRDIQDRTGRTRAQIDSDLAQLKKKGVATESNGRWKYAGKQAKAVTQGVGAIRIALKTKGRATVMELAKETGWSEQTVRENLPFLEVGGLARKVGSDRWEWIDSAKTSRRASKGRPASAKKKRTGTQIQEICSCSSRTRDLSTGRFVKGAGKPARR